MKWDKTVKCPVCGADVGRQCLTVSGNRTATTHVLRKQLSLHPRLGGQKS